MKALFKKLRPHIFGGRQIAIRDRLVVSFIQQQAPGTLLLDAGAGPQRFKAMCGHLRYLSQDFGEYTGGDEFAGESLDKWNSRSCDIISDITAIPLESASVDAIICVEVFEHLARPIEAVKEFSRLVKPGGRVFITAPFNSQYHQMPYFFYSGFSSEFYRQHGLSFGLDLVKVVAIGDYYENIAQELLRLPFLKGGILMKLLAGPMLISAYLYVLGLRVLKVPAPVSPMGYAIEYRKPLAKATQ
jgi:ubiquinone/menaquinone biosynthesis C-methylase UbiE